MNNSTWNSGAGKFPKKDPDHGKWGKKIKLWLEKIKCWLGFKKKCCKGKGKCGGK